MAKAKAQTTDRHLPLGFILLLIIAGIGVAGWSFSHHSQSVQLQPVTAAAAR